jgi:hypothetical protein
MPKRAENQIKKAGFKISPKDQALLDSKPTFPFMWRIWMKVWLFFNRIRPPKP